MTPVPLVTPEEYRLARTHIFPSLPSWQWFTRKNRAALIEKRALSMPTGRLMVDPEAFDKAVVEIGHATVAEAA